MADPKGMIIKKLKEKEKNLEENAVKFEEVTGRPSSKTYSFFDELKADDAINPAELAPLFWGEKIGPKKR